MDDLIFKDRLREALNSRGMSAAELARRCRMDKSSISRYLHGTSNPKWNAVYTLSSVLGVSPSWLLGCDIDPKPVDIPPIPEHTYNPIDYSKLNQKNRICIKAYYQALLDSQEAQDE